MEDGVVVASTKAKKELIERGEQIPRSLSMYKSLLPAPAQEPAGRSLSTYESLLPAPAQEPAGSDVMYEPATDNAVFLDIPSLTVLERMSSLNYVIYIVLRLTHNARNTPGLFLDRCNEPTCIVLSREDG